MEPPEIAVAFSAKFSPSVPSNKADPGNALAFRHSTLALAVSARIG